MISEFGLPSWPVSLLLAIRYLLVPVSLWAGFISDRHPLWGLHRSPYIWFGRGMMVTSLPCIALSLNCYSGGVMPGVGWLLAAIGFILYGFGGLLSGSPFIALVRDSTPFEKRGLAMTVVETLMIACFPISAILFAGLMEHYSAPAFWWLTILTMVMGGFFWIFSTIGVEQPRHLRAVHGSALRTATLREAIAEAMSDVNTRRFFFFLSLASLSAWMQDAILEPFGADVFNLSVGATTRFSAYWMGSTLVALVVTMVLMKGRRPDSLSGVASRGLVIMGVGMATLALSAFLANGAIVVWALVLFGLGFGVYTFAGLNLMMAMTSDSNAGFLLGIWTVAQVVSRGIGISLGGVLRDSLGLWFGELVPAYVIIFSLEALGLWGAVCLLRRINVRAYVEQPGESFINSVRVTAEM